MPGKSTKSVKSATIKKESSLLEKRLALIESFRAEKDKGIKGRFDDSVQLLKSRRQMLSDAIAPKVADLCKIMDALREKHLSIPTKLLYGGVYAGYNDRVCFHEKTVSPRDDKIDACAIAWFDGVDLIIVRNNGLVDTAFKEYVYYEHDKGQIRLEGDSWWINKKDDTNDETGTHLNNELANRLANDQIYMLREIDLFYSNLDRLLTRK